MAGGALLLGGRHCEHDDDETGRSTLFPRLILVITLASFVAFLV